MSRSLLTTAKCNECNEFRDCKSRRKFMFLLSTELCLRSLDYTSHVGGTVTVKSIPFLCENQRKTAARYSNKIFLVKKERACTVYIYTHTYNVNLAV